MSPFFPSGVGKFVSVRVFIVSDLDPQYRVSNFTFPNLFNHFWLNMKFNNQNYKKVPKFANIGTQKILNCGWTPLFFGILGHYFEKANNCVIWLEQPLKTGIFLYFSAPTKGVEHVYETPKHHEVVVTSPSSSARSSRLSNGFYRDSGNDSMYTSSGKWGHHKKPNILK